MFIAIGIFFVFLLLGMPVAFSIGLSGFSFFMIRDLPMTVLVQKSISTSQSFTMLAIPLFILAGNLMNSCGITKRLMRFANACTGHMYGNIGQVSCLMSTLMGGVSGSAVADASMECRILGPEMTRLGYDRGWSAAINGLSGLIVATIPPSMGLIIYGTVGEVSIGRLFMAGWGPGVLMCVLFQSQYGKTECWHILSGHPVNGEEPCIYYGFQPDMTRARWEALFHAQDIPGMLAGMQKYPVHPGDTILIEGGMPHAIGAGCFLVEIQEPTDYTIRVERTTPSGFAVADSMCHQGLGFEKMFECFHYEPHSREEIHDRWFIEPETVLKTAGGSITTLVGYRNTPLFRLDEVNVSDTLTVDCPPRGSGIYVLEGAGTLSANGRSLPLKKTDQLFVPAGTGRFTLDAEAPLRVLHFFGPEQKQ